MTMKDSLAIATNFAAAVCNHKRLLLDIAKAIPEKQFVQLTTFHPDTLQRDLEWADRNFEKMQAEYEKHCQETGVPSYATYNED